MKRLKLLVLSLIVLAGLAVASSPVVLQFLVLWGARAAAAFDQNALASRTFESDGVRLRYIAEGSGHPVVLVHGFASSLEHNWHDTGVIDLLTRAGFQVIAYDARGHGRSDKPHDPTRYGAEDVRDIIRLLDHLGLERAHLVGYSRGAMLAHHAREWHPERLRTVTLGGYGSSGRGSGLEVRVVPAADHIEVPAAKEFGAALVEFLRRHDRRPADPATRGRRVP
ncbi:MAG TPA: alpha/beta hydrolase [Longimicrobiales bacterium]|nr:alpha/beta hydrolase [Longimicrobiales bacterium]